MEASQSTDRPFPRIGQELRLDNRCVRICRTASLSAPSLHSPPGLTPHVAWCWCWCRWLDLRVPANNCIMRIQSGVCQLFRESLYSQGFMEIHSPKLIGGRQAAGP